jgi:hypothetical protein
MLRSSWLLESGPVKEEQLLVRRVEPSPIVSPQRLGNCSLEGGTWYWYLFCPRELPNGYLNRPLDWPGEVARQGTQGVTVTCTVRCHGCLL